MKFFVHKRNGGQSIHPLKKGITYWKSVHLWDSPLHVHVRQHDVIFCVKTWSYFAEFMHCNLGNLESNRTIFTINQDSKQIKFSDQPIVHWHC